MEYEDPLKLLQELLNLGYFDEVPSEATHIYVDLQFAIKYIYEKRSTFSDKQANLHMYGLNNSTPAKIGRDLGTNNVNQPNLNKILNPTNSASSPIPKPSIFPYSPLPFQSKFSVFNKNTLIRPPSTKESIVPSINPSDTFVQKLSSPQVPAPAQYLNFPPSQFHQTLPKVQESLKISQLPPSPFPSQSPSYLKFAAPTQNPPFAPKDDSVIIVPKDNFERIIPDDSKIIVHKDNFKNFVPIKDPEVYNSDCVEHKSLENEEFYKFMAYCLGVRGLNEEIISAICGLCTTKEEVLQILDIPIYYKSLPFSEIPGHYIFMEKDPGDSFDKIYSIGYRSPSVLKKLMINLGVPEILAYKLSVTFMRIDQALNYLFQEMDQEVYTDHIHKPKTPPAVPDPPPPPPPPAHYNPFPFHHVFDLPESYSSSRLYQPHQRPLLLKQPSKSDPIAPEIKTDYFEKLKSFRLVLSESPEAFINFKLGSVNLSGPQFTRRINKEIKSIESSVPCGSAASIFTLIDEKCMHRIYFLLSGTIDTPYAHGLYLFEVLLPENYPNSPPKVKIVTTGNGSINFNPNLYNCGHICLSIINTWAGRPEEQWNPESSTLLQVMLSIQSLVMDNNIIHKEPGFDKYPSNCPENLTYQYEVKYGNIKYAMIENIKKPPLGFEEVVRNHFKCKKEEILNTVYNWTKEMQSVHNIGFTLQNQNINAEINIIGPYQAFSDLYSELYTLLDKL